MSNSADELLGGYAAIDEIDADVAALEASWRAPAPAWCAASQIYDADISAPRDALQAKLDQAQRRSLAESGRG